MIINMNRFYFSKIILRISQTLFPELNIRYNIARTDSPKSIHIL